MVTGGARPRSTKRTDDGLPERTAVNGPPYQFAAVGVLDIKAARISASRRLRFFGVHPPPVAAHDEAAVFPINLYHARLSRSAARSEVPERTRPAVGAPGVPFEILAALTCVHVLSLSASVEATPRVPASSGNAPHLREARGGGRLVGSALDGLAERIARSAADSAVVAKRPHGEAGDARALLIRDGRRAHLAEL